MNDLLYFLITGGAFSIAVFMLATRINRAIKIANNKRPYNPPKQMYYQNGFIHFKEGSQRVCWWITFWDEI